MPQKSSGVDDAYLGRYSTRPQPQYRFHSNRSAVSCWFKPALGTWRLSKNPHVRKADRNRTASCGVRPNTV
ncbi:hypothetical protein M408DRAFT_334269, partial [Serendipita vermifera MAFF 305830]